MHHDQNFDGPLMQLAPDLPHRFAQELRFRVHGHHHRNFHGHSFGTGLSSPPYHKTWIPNRRPRGRPRSRPASTGPSRGQSPVQHRSKPALGTSPPLLPEGDRSEEMPLTPSIRSMGYRST